MGEKGKRTIPVIFAIISVLMMVLSTVAAMIQVPLFGLELKLDDYLDEQKGPLRQLSMGPYNPDIDPKTGVFLQDMTAICREGKIPSLQFTVGLMEGYPPVNLSRCWFHFMGSTESNYYYLDDPDNLNPSNYTVLADPDGVIARGLLNSKALVSIMLHGVNEIPGGRFIISFEPGIGREDYYQFRLPLFLTEPPYDLGCKNAARIIDTDGTFPRPSKSDWVIGNQTILENVNITLEKNIVVIDNGSLILRNSTVLVNSSYEHHLSMIVGARGSMEVHNTTISPLDITNQAFYFDIYSMCIMGEFDMDGSSIFYSIFDILSDNAEVNNSLVDGLGCGDCSPKIANNTLSRLVLSHSSALVANNTFGTFDFPGERADANRTSRGLELADDSSPLVVGNRFMNLPYGIMSDRGSNPQIIGNTFTGGRTGILFEGKSYGLVDGNRLENLTTGILVDYFDMCSIIVRNNNISAHQGINVQRLNTAIIVNNTFFGYTEYGIFSDNSFTRQEGNRFFPASNNDQGSFGARAQWLVKLGLVRENRKNGLEYHYSKMLVKNGEGMEMRRAGRFTSEVPYIPDIPALFVAQLQEYSITNEGKQEKCNPHLIIVEHLGSKESIRFTVNRTTVLFVVMGQKQSVLANGLFAILFIAGVAATAKLIAPSVVRWWEARKARKSTSPPPLSPQVDNQPAIVDWQDPK